MAPNKCLSKSQRCQDLHRTCDKVDLLGSQSHNLYRKRFCATSLKFKAYYRNFKSMRESIDLLSFLNQSFLRSYQSGAIHAP